MLKDKQVAYTGSQIPETTVKAALDWLAVNGGGGGGGNPKEIHITLNSVVTGTTPTYIGAVYIDRAGTINSGTKAYIGGLTGTDTATLELYPSGSATPLVSASVTGSLANVNFSGSTSISIGWYDIVLYAGASNQTAIARGLYVHV